MPTLERPEIPGNPGSYPKGGSFAKLLDWHLDFGTRPNGNPAQEGDRWNNKGARKAYEAALPLYRTAGDVQGEANCIFGLGEIALARADHEGARKAFEAALPLYRTAGDVQGEANCLEKLRFLGRS